MQRVVNSICDSGILRFDMFFMILLKRVLIVSWLRTHSGWKRHVNNILLIAWHELLERVVGAASRSCVQNAEQRARNPYRCEVCLSSWNAMICTATVAKAAACVVSDIGEEMLPSDFFIYINESMNDVIKNHGFDPFSQGCFEYMFWNPFPDIKYFKCDCHLSMGF